MKKISFLVLAFLLFLPLINSFEYTSTKVTGCIEGKQMCEMGHTELWTCLSDGSYTKEECRYGCDGIKNPPRCVLEEDWFLEHPLSEHPKNFPTNTLLLSATVLIGIIILGTLIAKKK